MLGTIFTVIRVGALGCAAAFWTHAADKTESDLERRFSQTVKPFVVTYCGGCHGGKSPAARFDLQAYSSISTVVQDYGRWNLVLEKLAAGEMPPKPATQPPAEARQAVIDWVREVRTNEAQKSAGDPGPVPARRLSNSEYNYTIRDLTGVDMRPAREFPVDPANTAGFDNSGESLTMSPELLNKYLQAARAVSDHMVLTPDGIDFAPHPMLVETDREKYAIKRIVDFYERQPTDFAEYFQAAWRFKHRGNAKATLAGVAVESKVSPKYLPMVWQLLEGPQEVGPAGKLQAMWRALPPPGDKAVENAVRAKCVEMRDFVARIRHDTAMQFAAPVVQGLPAGSQPLLNWKLYQFAAHRRESDAMALRNDTDPPMAAPPIPRYPGLHQEAAYRWAALVDKSRATDQDLIVPAAERARYEAAFQRFAHVFPDAFYIRERGRYFPDDSQDKGRLLSAGYHNVMGYFRDDTPLMELILDEQGKDQLNRLWEEFDFISDYTARTWDQFYFNQSGEVQGKGAEAGTLRPGDAAVNTSKVIFELRDAYLAKAEPSNNPEAIEAIRDHFQRVNDTLRGLERSHLEAEPHHLEALQRFAAHAYRRPLTSSERDDLVAYYRSLREKSGLTHEDAIRDSIVRVLMSPKFCYRIDLIEAASKKRQHTVTRVATVKPGPVTGTPLSANAIASRLSYFLWSSMPDDELMARAASGDLHKTDALEAEVRRMLQDSRARGLAVEFGGNWLDFRRFEDHNAVDRERFPSFTNDLREAMFQEPVRFLEDTIRNDRSVLDLLYGNYTFVNPVLAKHYGMADVKGGPDTWVRVDNANEYGRGGLLPMAVFLTQNAPGLRTSPVKRGYWVVRRVLGEVIPPPPATVPELPNDEAKMNLPLRDVLAKHRSVQVCAACHARFDSFGLAFEGYGPIGEKRANDLAGHPVQTQFDYAGGGHADGFEGVRTYIREHRQNDFLNNFSRKLLAFALGRSLMLSDDPLIEQMKAASAARGYRFVPLVETIVSSSQFRNRRSVGPDTSPPGQKGD